MASSKTTSSRGPSKSGLATTRSMAGRKNPISGSTAVSRTQPCGSGRKSSWTRDASPRGGHYADNQRRPTTVEWSSAGPSPPPDPGALALKPAGPAATILQPSLRARVDLRGLVGALRGTWIGPLRWYGFSEADEGLRLGWALEDDSIGIEILVRPGQLTMTAKVDSSNRLDEATRLGYELFHHVSREISSNAERGISA